MNVDCQCFGCVFVKPHFTFFKFRIYVERRTGTKLTETEYSLFVVYYKKNHASRV